MRPASTPRPWSRCGCVGRGWSPPGPTRACRACWPTLGSRRRWTGSPRTRPPPSTSGSPSGPHRLVALMDRHAPAAAGAEQGWLPREGAVSAREGPRRGAAAVADRHRRGRCGDGSGALPTRERPGSRSGSPCWTSRTCRSTRARARWGRRPSGAGGGRRPRRWSRRCCCGPSATSGRGWCTLHVWDVGQLTGSLPGLYPLTRTGLLTVHDPGNLEGLLDELSDRIRRVHTRVLVDGHPSLQALAREAHQRPEPWVVAVLVGDGTPLARTRSQVQRVLRGGPACGISLVLVDVPMTIGAPLETVRLHSVRRRHGPRHRRRHLDDRPARHRRARPAAAPRGVIGACHADRRRARAGGARRVATFQRAAAGGRRVGRADSREALCAPVGFVEGDPRRAAARRRAPRTR